MTGPIGTMMGHGLAASQIGGGMSWFAPAALLGGSAISTLGGIVGAQSANRNQRKWQDEQARDTAINRNRLGYSLFGMQPFENLMTAGNYTAGTPASRQAAYDSFIKSIGGPVNEQFKAVEQYGNNMGGAIRSGYEAATPGLLEAGRKNVRVVQGDYRDTTDSVLGGYDKAAGDLTKRVTDYGRGRQAIIDDDAKRMERALNLKSDAALYASGMGNSTRRASRRVANALEVERGRTRASQDLADSQVDREVGLGRSLLSERTGVKQGMEGRRLDALERGSQDNLNYERSRSENLTNLDIQNLERNIGLKQGQLAQLLAAISGTTQGTSTPYIPTYSPTATGLTGAGNALAQYGSMQTMLDMMDKMRGK